MDERLSAEAVENLVTQFSSALDFYRELVQNSIDAGSSSIVVWTAFEPGEGVDGVISLHVDDFGEGMNEEIIDNGLTELFSSSKEGDLTKIGKFGIGFVSVFAPKPKGVLVHTGRDGEYWEVFFHEDRSFTKTRVDTPIEGTQITLFLVGDRTRYRELVEGSVAALKKWCAHSDTEITFEDRSPADGQSRGETAINEPFAVAGDCGVTVEHPGTELALAYSDVPMYGFYNKGLALAVTHAAEDVLEARANRFRHIAFKIKSRYLEHTLSRETVMRDENYDKAMTLLDEAAERQLRHQLVAELVAVCAEPDWGLQQTSRYARLMRFLAAEPDAAYVTLREAKILRGVNGGAHAMRAVEDAVERDGWVFIASSASRLTALLAAQDVVVFWGAADVAELAGDVVGQAIARYLAIQARLEVLGFLRARAGVDHHAEAVAKLAHPERVMVGVTLVDNPPQELRELLRSAHELLEAADRGYREILLGELESTPHAPPRLFVLGRELAEVMPLPPRGLYTRGRFERPRVVVNGRHPHVRRLLGIARIQPELAAYCLAKALMLEEDRALHEDIVLVDHATRTIRPQFSS